MMRAFRSKVTKIVILSVHFITWSSIVLAGPNDDLIAGLVAGKKGDYSEAIRLFSRGIKGGTIEREFLASSFNNRGVAYRRKGLFHRAIADYNRAIWYYEKALKLWPDNQIAKKNLLMAKAIQANECRTVSKLE